MRIIVSPTKQMKITEDLEPLGQPAQLERSQQLLSWLRGLSFEEARKLWGCSEKLAASAYEAMQAAQLDSALASPAVLAYDGIAFKYMAPSVFNVDELSYTQEHLRILSALYGVLRPMDGIVEYRLEMQQKAQVAGCRDLYEFWGSTLYDEVMLGNNDRTVVNLASKEYSRCIERFLQPEDTFVTCTFAQETDGKLVQKGVWCKMARGEMVRYMAANNVSNLEQLKGFDSPDWRFSADHSCESELVFLHCD